MANYRNRLDRSRPYAGIQAVLYKQANPDAKVDTDVSDELGYYEFNNIPTGAYIVRFYGGDYTEDEYLTIFVTEDLDSTEYFIRAVNGTVIKDSAAREASLTTTGGKVYVLRDQLTNLDEVTVSATYTGSGQSFGDSITLVKLEEASGKVIPVLSNESQILKTDEEGTVQNFEPAECSIRVFDGIEPLIYNEGGTATEGYFDVTKTVISGNATLGTEAAVTNELAGDTYRLSAPTDFSTNEAVIEFDITGKDLEGNTFSFTRTQTLKKSPLSSNTSGFGINASTQIFRKPATNLNVEPQFIELKAAVSNLTGGAISWTTSEDIDLFDSSAVSLDVEIQKLENGVTSQVNSGDVKLYILKSGNFELLSAQDNVKAPNDYKASISSLAIFGTLDVYAIEAPDTEDEFVYDTITLADISDGVGFVGWVIPSSYIATQTTQLDEEDKPIFFPAEITMTPYFALDGVEIATEFDQDFSFEAISVADDAQNGLNVNEKSGVITITTKDYFDDESVLTATWVARYVKGSKVYRFAVTETIYKGQTVPTNLSVTADERIFRKLSDQPDLIPAVIAITGRRNGLPGKDVAPIIWETEPEVTLLNAVSGQATVSGEAVYLTIENFGDNSSVTVTGKVTVPESEEVFSDEIAILKLTEGSGNITADLSNPSHSFAALPDGQIPDYSGGGTDIRVFEGLTPLVYSGSATTGYFSVTASTGIGEITPSATTSVETTDIADDTFRYGPPSDMNTEAATIIYSIEGLTKDGTFFTFNKIQSFTRVKDGQASPILRVLPSSFTFTKPKDSDILLPEFIQYDTIKTNLTGEDVTWSTDPSVPLYSAATGGELITSGGYNTAYLRREDFSGQSVLVSAEVSNNLGTFRDQAAAILIEEGLDTIDVIVTNQAHTVQADVLGVVQDNFIGSGTDILVYEGNVPLTYADVPGKGQFSVSASVTEGSIGIGNASTASTNIADDTRRFAKLTSMSSPSAQISFTVSGKRLDGSSFSYQRAQSFSKSFAGKNAPLVKIVPEGLTFTKPLKSNTLTPGSLEFKAETANLEGESITWSTSPAVNLYDARTGGSVTTSDNTVYLRNSDFSGNNPVTVTVSISKDGETYTDKSTVILLDEGLNGVVAVLSNEAHTFPADASGDIDSADYAGGGTLITVYEGADKLTYTPGTPADKEYTVSSSNVGSVGTITPGGISISGGDALVADPSGMTSPKAAIDYTISGNREDGSPFTSFTKRQSFSKSLTGKDAYTFTISPQAYNLNESPAGLIPSFSTTVSGDISQGSNSRNADYRIKSFTVKGESGAIPDSELGLGGFTTPTTAGDLSITVNELNVDFAQLEIVFEDTTGEGPEFKGSCVFTRGKAGDRGPGVLYIGRHGDLSGGRELNNNNNARDVVKLGNDFYAYIGDDGQTVTSAGTPPNSNWELISQFSSIATGLLIAEESYVQNTINVGTNPDGDSGNIVIYGSDNNPYISLGQDTIGYDEVGIFLGTEAGLARVSFESQSGQALLFDGEQLVIRGNITNGSESYFLNEQGLSFAPAASGNDPASLDFYDNLLPGFNYGVLKYSVYYNQSEGGLVFDGGLNKAIFKNPVVLESGLGVSGAAKFSSGVQSPLFYGESGGSGGDGGLATDGTSTTLRAGDGGDWTDVDLGTAGDGGDLFIRAGYGGTNASQGDDGTDGTVFIQSNTEIQGNLDVTGSVSFQTGGTGSSGTFSGTNEQVKLIDTDASDPNDFLILELDGEETRFKYWDDTAGAYLNHMIIGDSGSTFVGSRAGSSGTNMTAFGYQSGKGSIGKEFSGFGFRAGEDNNSINTSAFGTYSGFGNTGDESVFVGFYSGFENTAEGGAGIGVYSLYQNTGARTTGVGFWSGYGANSEYAVFIGSYAGYQREGARNINIGYASGFNSTGGERNVALGYRSMQNVTTVGSDHNVAIGYYAGAGSAGARNIWIGSGIGDGSTYDNTIVLGYYDQATADNQFIVAHSYASSTPLIEGDFAAGSVKIDGVVQTKTEFQALVNDQEYILKSLNNSASGNPQQFSIKHNSGNVEIANSRGSINFVSQVYINDTTSATINGDGALQVAGGGYFAENLYAIKEVRAQKFVNTNPSTGLLFNGGNAPYIVSFDDFEIRTYQGADYTVALTVDARDGQHVTLHSTTQATTAGAGALQVAGGGYFAKTLIADDFLFANGDTIFTEITFNNTVLRDNPSVSLESGNGSIIINTTPFETDQGITYNLEVDFSSYNDIYVESGAYSVKTGDIPTLTFTFSQQVDDGAGGTLLSFDVPIDGLDNRYLQSYTETDPVFTASDAFDITANQISNWDEAYTNSIPQLSAAGDLQGLTWTASPRGLSVDISLSEINNVFPGTLSGGEFLQYNSSTGNWEGVDNPDIYSQAAEFRNITASNPELFIAYGTDLANDPGFTVDLLPLDNRYAAASHTHAAGDITSGTFSYDRLPISSGQVSNWDEAYNKSIPQLSANGQLQGLTYTTSPTGLSVTIPLEELTNVNTGTLSGGELLGYNSSTSNWEAFSNTDTYSQEGELRTMASNPELFITYGTLAGGDPGFTIALDALDDRYYTESEVYTIGQTDGAISTAVTNAINGISQFIEVTDGNNADNVALGGTLRFAQSGDITVSQGAGVVTIGANFNEYGSWSLREENDSLSGISIGSGDSVTFKGGTDVQVTRSGREITISSTNSGDITAVLDGAGLTGGGTSGSVTLSHASPGSTSNTYGSTASNSKIDTIEVDQFGHIVAVNSSLFSSSSGDITAVNNGAGLAGGGTSGSVTLSHADTTLLNSGTYGSTASNSKIDTIEIDQFGHIVNITTGAVASSSGDITAVLDGAGLTGGGTSGNVTLSHASPGSTSNTYGSTGSNSKIDTIEVDQFGHIVAVNSSLFSSSSGDITAVNNGAGLAGGGTSGSVTLSHADTTLLNSGTYGSTASNSKIDTIEIDQFGHITGVSVQTGLALSDFTQDSISISGTISATGDITAFSSSDLRLKENFAIIEDPLDKISKLRGTYFTWKDTVEDLDNSSGVSGEKDIGVIAQEVEKIFPELVVTRDDGYKAVRYEKLIPVLIEGIKELKKEIERLKNK